ncbi:hypothetical protein ACFO8Q_21140 [Effusibacillus consociatus]|uniref:Uncharacterized protein n=1 Tax=Effusibacillus consociatus TaxID=1117041 RepID=A0ABV9Q5P1_9BACL
MNWEKLNGNYESPYRWGGGKCAQKREIITISCKNASNFQTNPQTPIRIEALYNGLSKFGIMKYKSLLATLLLVSGIGFGIANASQENKPTFNPIQSYKKKKINTSKDGLLN